MSYKDLRLDICKVKIKKHLLFFRFSGPVKMPAAKATPVIRCRFSDLKFATPSKPLCEAHRKMARVMVLRRRSVLGSSPGWREY